MKTTRTKGSILIIAIIILASVGAAMVAALLSSSIGGYKDARLYESSAQARALADACAETALEKLAAASSFSGTGTVTAGAGSCSYAVSANGPFDAITVSATVGTVVRKEKITISVPQLILASWQEVGDY